MRYSDGKLRERSELDSAKNEAIRACVEQYQLEELQRLKLTNWWLRRVLRRESKTLSKSAGT